MDELVLGTAAIRPSIREKDGRPTHAKEAIGDKHGSIVAKVPVKGDVLHAHHQGIGVGMHLFVCTYYIQRMYGKEISFFFI